MAYTTLTEVKNHLGIASDVDDVLLTDLILVAQEWVDRHCGRTFEALEDSTRMLDVTPLRVSDGGKVLHLDDDLCSITQVVNGDLQTIDTTEYVQLPIQPPYWQLRLKASSGKVWTYLEDPYQAIAVTGKWAYSLSPPAPVVKATIEVVRWLYHNQKAGDDTEDADLPKVAQMLLDRYVTRF